MLGEVRSEAAYEKAGKGRKEMRWEDGQILFSMFLLVAACQDMKKKSVGLWVYIIFGIAAAVRFILLAGNVPGWDRLGGIFIGLVLLVLGKATAGAIGSGDGWFFAIAGGILGYKDILRLLAGGLLLCGLFSLVIYLKGRWIGKNTGKETVPFLPFLVPVWIWMLLE